MLIEMLILIMAPPEVGEALEVLTRYPGSWILPVVSFGCYARSRNTHAHMCNLNAGVIPVIFTAKSPSSGASSLPALPSSRPRESLRLGSARLLRRSRAACSAAFWEAFCCIWCIACWRKFQAAHWSEPSGGIDSCEAGGRAPESSCVGHCVGSGVVGRSREGGKSFVFFGLTKPHRKNFAKISPAPHRRQYHWHHHHPSFSLAAASQLHLSTLWFEDFARLKQHHY